MYVEERKLGETEIDEAGKILSDAAEYIVRHGWCQCVVENPNGAVCALGAICHATNDMIAQRLLAFSPPNTLARLKKVIGIARLDESWHDIQKWNDAPGRTKEHVVAALRGAARTPAITHGRSTLGLRKWFEFGIKA